MDIFAETERPPHLTPALSAPRGGEGEQTAPARIPGGPKAREMSGTGPRSGPAGVTAPARRKARSQASGASARRLREHKKSGAEAPGA